MSEGVRIAAKLYRKRTVMNLSGEIIDWQDQTPDGGGAIVRKGEIVNQKRIDEFNQKEKDKSIAAVAIEHEKKDVPQEIIAQRNTNPSETGQTGTMGKRVDDLEKKVETIGSDVGEILKILKQK